MATTLQSDPTWGHAQCTGAIWLNPTPFNIHICAFNSWNSRLLLKEKSCYTWSFVWSKVFRIVLVFQQTFIQLLIHGKCYKALCFVVRLFTHGLTLFLSVDVFVEIPSTRHAGLTGVSVHWGLYLLISRVQNPQNKITLFTCCVVCFQQLAVIWSHSNRRWKESATAPMRRKAEATDDPMCHPFVFVGVLTFYLRFNKQLLNEAWHQICQNNT